LRGPAAGCVPAGAERPPNSDLPLEWPCAGLGVRQLRQGRRAVRHEVGQFIETWGDMGIYEWRKKSPEPTRAPAEELGSSHRQSPAADIASDQTSGPQDRKAKKYNLLRLLVIAAEVAFPESLFKEYLAVVSVHYGRFFLGSTRRRRDLRPLVTNPALDERSPNLTAAFRIFRFFELGRILMLAITVELKCQMELFEFVKHIDADGESSDISSSSIPLSATEPDPSRLTREAVISIAQIDRWWDARCSRGILLPPLPSCRSNKPATRRVSSLGA
jgi:hypothetical protein